MQLEYGTAAFNRERGNFPELPVINMFAEDVPTEPHTTLQSRPGLQNSTTQMGAGPVKALFQIDGVLDGSVFGVSAGHLYKGATDLGAVAGTGPAKIDGFETFVFATSGTTLYKYDGATLGTIATPGGFDVLDLCVGSSRLIVVDKGTGRFYWSDVLTDNLPVLNFATAENSPDKLKACLYIGDTLILFGTETVEFWPVNANADAPFQPLVGRVFPVGIKDTGCVARIGADFAWVTSQNQVCVSDPNNIASFPGLEAKIEASSAVSLWTFRLEGDEYLALRLDTETWILNSRSKKWSQFASFGETNWVPQCYANGYFGSSLDGHLIQWTSDHQDFSNILERRFRAGLVIDNGTTNISNITVRGNPGQTPFLTGDYANPMVEMRLSSDGGFTWTEYREIPLGANGKYRRQLSWLSLGYFSYPGVIAEFRVTDPVPFRVSNVTANEGYGQI